MRVRITFSKTGSLIYIGNLDLLTLWERAARRAGLALAYSQGFHPQPKIQFAAPLPLGFSSRCEIIEIRLSQVVDLAALQPRLAAALPAGIDILAVEATEAQAPALQTRVRAAEYEVTVSEGFAGPELRRRIETLLGAKSAVRKRRNKEYDLRPLIEELKIVPDSNSKTMRLRMRLKALEGATGRPDEVLDALGVKRDLVKIERTRLVLAPGI